MSKSPHDFSIVSNEQKNESKGEKRMSSFSALNAIFLQLSHERDFELQKLFETRSHPGKSKTIKREDSETSSYPSLFNERDLWLKKFKL